MLICIYINCLKLIADRFEEFFKCFDEGHSDGQPWNVPKNNLATRSCRIVFNESSSRTVVARLLNTSDWNLRALFSFTAHDAWMTCNYYRPFSCFKWERFFNYKGKHFTYFLIFYFVFLCTSVGNFVILQLSIESMRRAIAFILIQTISCVAFFFVSLITNYCARYMPKYHRLNWVLLLHAALERSLCF